MEKKNIRPSLLVIVRHAESERNKIRAGSVYFADEDARKTVKGVPDHKISLTETGLLQAEETGRAIRERFGTFDYIYHSGYLRTIQTAEKILDAYSLEERRFMRVRQNPFIRERDSGYAYDMTVEEAEKAFSWLREYWQTFGGFFARPVGGESLAQVAERVYLFLNMLFRDRGGQKVLVVTHGGTIRSFRFLLERWNYDQALAWPTGESPKNCGVTVYEYQDSTQTLALKEYNTVYWK